MTEDAKSRLIELLATGVEPNSPEAVKLLQSHPELHDELHELCALARALQSAGRDARADHEAAAAEPPSAADLQLAREALARSVTMAPAPKPGPRIVASAIVAAAAAALVLWLMGAFGPASRTLPANMVLGVGDAGLVTEVDTNGYRGFHWSYPATDDRSFEVRVFAVEPQPTPEPLFGSGELEDTQSWTPTAEQLAQLNRHRTIRWELVILEFGQPVDTRSSTVERP